MMSDIENNDIQIISKQNEWKYILTFLFNRHRYVNNAN
jgi:hypothetical protein